jgi:Family of unknown function (DUF6488)
MKRISFVAIFALLMTAATNLYAGPGHSHDLPERAKIDDQGAIAAASKYVPLMIARKTPVEGAELDAEWGTTADENKAISKKGQGYYVVSFNNPAKGKMLYLLLSDTGELYNANFTGTFIGLNE